MSKVSIHSTICTFISLLFRFCSFLPLSLRYVQFNIVLKEIRRQYETLKMRKMNNGSLQFECIEYTLFHAINNRKLKKDVKSSIFCHVLYVYVDNNNNNRDEKCKVTSTVGGSCGASSPSDSLSFCVWSWILVLSQFLQWVFCFTSKNYYWLRWETK